MVALSGRDAVPGYGHIFQLSQPEDLDEDLVDLLREAYAIGTLEG